MREVVITDTAKEDIELIADFLQKKYSNNSRIDFLLILSEKLQLIENMPFMYPVSKTNNKVFNT
jgi:plasmid stabilization system protein ParE